MQGELVFTTTPDHVRLHGFYSRSGATLRTGAALGHCDVAILLHGLGGNFYSSRLLLHLAATLKTLGLDTLIANSRGHDMVNTMSWAGRAKSAGAAFERVSDSAFDIRGWVQFLRDRGHQNCLLVGHSLGAIKSLYYLAHQPDDHVAAMVGLSATRLSHARMLSSQRGDLFRQTLETCQQQVDAGLGEELIHVPFPFPTWMTPSGYLEKYGPDEKYNWLKFVDRVQQPALLMFGERELDQNPAFEGLRDELTSVTSLNRGVTVEEIPGADHFYAGYFEPVDELLRRWLVQ